MLLQCRSNLPNIFCLAIFWKRAVNWNPDFGDFSKNVRFKMEPKNVRFELEPYTFLERGLKIAFRLNWL